MAGVCGTSAGTLSLVFTLFCAFWCPFSSVNKESPPSLWHAVFLRVCSNGMAAPPAKTTVQPGSHKCMKLGSWCAGGGALRRASRTRLRPATLLRDSQRFWQRIAHHKPCRACSSGQLCMHPQATAAGGAAGLRNGSRPNSATAVPNTGNRTYDTPACSRLFGLLHRGSGSPRLAKSQK